MIWCLHGFLGHGSDWDAFRPAWRAAADRAGVADPVLADSGTAAEVNAPSLFQAPPGGLNLPAWGERFGRDVAASDARPILVGYSLGGRLALHALVAAPTVFAGAIIVSAHPGLADEAARADRVAADERWARRFEGDDWASVLDDWNAQPVFSGGGPSDVSRTGTARSEQDFNRRALAAALRDWSLGAQRDLRDALGEIDCPVLWIAGERDAKFVGLARESVEHLPNGELSIIDGAGHRVPWEAPRRFMKTTTAFLSDVWRE